MQLKIKVKRIIKRKFGTGRFASVQFYNNANGTKRKQSN